MHRYRVICGAHPRVVHATNKTEIETETLNGVLWISRKASVGSLSYSLPTSTGFLNQAVAFEVFHIITDALH